MEKDHPSVVYPKAYNGQGWPRVSDRNSILVSSHQWQESKYFHHNLLTPRVCISRNLKPELDLGVDSDNLMWVTHLLTSVLATMPEICPVYFS